MAWDKGWDNIFANNEWGKYPPVDLVRFVARAFGKAPDRKNVSILEVGCGPGANLWYIAREGYKASGIDGSAIAVQRAKDRLAAEGLKADILVGDVLKLPFPDASFDAVIDIECIYANSMEDSLAILKEIKRVLKPGGLLFSQTFMTGTHEGALRSGYGLIRYTSKEDIKKLYGSLEIVNVDYVTRSEKNGTYEIKEWLITCRKPEGEK